MMRIELTDMPVYDVLQKRYCNCISPEKSDIAECKIHEADKKNIAEYFNLFDAGIKERLTIIRHIVFEEVPDADEDIKYRMPTIIYHGNLIHSAGFKNHIGIYPLPRVLEMMGDELKKYKTGKGSVQFRNDELLPVGLIRRIVRTRKAEKDRELEEKRK